MTISLVANRAFQVAWEGIIILSIRLASATATMSARMPSSVTLRAATCEPEGSSRMRTRGLSFPNASAASPSTADRLLAWKTTTSVARDLHAPSGRTEPQRTQRTQRRKKFGPEFREPLPLPTSVLSVLSRRVHKWTRLESLSGAGRDPPLVREVNSRTSPHLRPSPWLGLPRTVQLMDSSSVVKLWERMEFIVR